MFVSVLVYVALANDPCVRCVTDPASKLDVSAQREIILPPSDEEIGMHYWAQIEILSVEPIRPQSGDVKYWKKEDGLQCTSAPIGAQNDELVICSATYGHEIAVSRTDQLVVRGSTNQFLAEQVRRLKLLKEG